MYVKGGGFCRRSFYPLHASLFLLFGDPVSEENSHLGIDHAPVLTPTGPLFCNVYHSQIEHFKQAVIRRENRLGFCHLSKLTVKALYGVGSVNQPPYFLRELKVGAKISPIVPP